MGTPKAWRAKCDKRVRNAKTRASRSKAETLHVRTRMEYIPGVIKGVHIGPPRGRLRGNFGSKYPVWVPMELVDGCRCMGGRRLEVYPWGVGCRRQTHSSPTGLEPPGVLCLCFCWCFCSKVGVGREQSPSTSQSVDVPLPPFVSLGSAVSRSWPERCCDVWRGGLGGGVHGVLGPTMFGASGVASPGAVLC